MRVLLENNSRRRMFNNRNMQPIRPIMKHGLFNEPKHGKAIGVEWQASSVLRSPGECLNFRELCRVVFFYSVYITFLNRFSRTT